MEARGKAAPSLNKLLGEIYLADNQLAEAAKFLAEVRPPSAGLSLVYLEISPLAALT